jgi:hypothetical protein
VGDAKIERARRGVTRQLALDRGAVADENQSDLQVPGGYERAVNDAGRSVVAPHRINRYSH